MTLIGTINEDRISEYIFEMGQDRVMRMEIVYNTPSFADRCRHEVVSLNEF